MCLSFRFRVAAILFAAIQIYVEHFTIVAQIDLKVVRQGCDFIMAVTKAKFCCIPRRSLVLFGAFAKKPSMAWAVVGLF